MNETPQELTDLQRLLNASAAAAGPHLREIITDERRVDAAAVCERLQGMRLLVVATVTADGRPLVGPVDVAGTRPGRLATGTCARRADAPEILAMEARRGRA